MWGLQLTLQSRKLLFNVPCHHQSLLPQDAPSHSFSHSVFHSLRPLQVSIPWLLLMSYYSHCFKGFLSQDFPPSPNLQTKISLKSVLPPYLWIVQFSLQKHPHSIIVFRNIGANMMILCHEYKWQGDGLRKWPQMLAVLNSHHKEGQLLEIGMG